MKIEIKNMEGSALFSHEVEGNTLLITLMAAVLSKANLYGADLRGANLYGANLRGADLYGANLYGEILTKAPVFVLNLHWDVTITPQFLKIGCQRHTHAAWGEFTDAEISRMHGEALKFWSKWKTQLLAMCEAHAKE